MFLDNRLNEEFSSMRMPRRKRRKRLSFDWANEQLLAGFVQEMQGGDWDEPIGPNPIGGDPQHSKRPPRPPQRIPTRITDDNPFPYVKPAGPNGPAFVNPPAPGNPVDPDAPNPWHDPYYNPDYPGGTEPPRRGPWNFDTPIDVDPDAMPDFFDGNSRTLRWMYYYNEWLMFFEAQKQILESQIARLKRKLETELCLSGANQCLADRQDLARLEGLLRETKLRMTRITKAAQVWWRRWWSIIGPQGRKNFKRKKPGTPKSRKKPDWWKRLFSLQAEDPSNPFYAAFVTRENDTISGEAALDILRDWYTEMASLMSGADDLGYDLRTIIEDLAAIFDGQPLDTQYSWDDLTDLLSDWFDGINAQAARNIESGNTSLGTYTKGGSFGQTPDFDFGPPVDGKAPPQTDTGGPQLSGPPGGEDSKVVKGVEGELARAFAKFNKGRLGRGMR